MAEPQVAGLERRTGRRPEGNDEHGEPRGEPDRPGIHASAPPPALTDVP